MEEQIDQQDHTKMTDEELEAATNPNAGTEQTPSVVTANYVDDDGQQQTYVLKENEVINDAGLIDPGARTVYEAAKGLPNAHAISQTQVGLVTATEQPAAQISDAEVAAAINAIPATVGAASVAPQVTAPVVAEAPVQQPATPSDPLEQLRASVGDDARNVIDQITGYMKAMKPGTPMVHQLGARQQVILYRALSTLINSVENDFERVFNAVLGLFNEHRQGVFHESYVFRFFEHIPLPDSDLKAFQRILNLIKLTANPQGRDLALKQADLESTLAHGITERGRSKLLAFFGR